MARLIPEGEALSDDAQDYMPSLGDEVIEVVAADGVTTARMTVAEAEEAERQGLLWDPPDDGKALTEEDVYGLDRD